MLRLLLVLVVLVAPPLILRQLGRPLAGRFLGIPYNFEPPTPARLKRALWDRSDDRVLTPHVYGWGYSLNLRAAARRLGLVGR